MTPQRPTYAFGLVAFVPHPHLRGLYLKTHVCVDLVACSYCGAEIHEPCRNKRSGWVSSTHVSRRNAAFGTRNRGVRAAPTVTHYPR